MKEAEAKKIFEVVHRDAQAWLSQAEQLRLSAAVIWAEWERILERPRNEPGVRQKMLAYSQAFMLLTGFAFENLLKGILFGRDPANGIAKKKKGHGIMEMARSLIVPTTREEDLLNRVQHYLTWAGRYQLPMTIQAFQDSYGQVGIHPDDPDTIEQLFVKLAEILKREWQAREQVSPA